MLTSYTAAISRTLHPLPIISTMDAERPSSLCFCLPRGCSSIQCGNGHSKQAGCRSHPPSLQFTYSNGSPCTSCMMANLSTFVLLYQQQYVARTLLGLTKICSGFINSMHEDTAVSEWNCCVFSDIVSNNSTGGHGSRRLRRRGLRSDYGS